MRIQKLESRAARVWQADPDVVADLNAKVFRGVAGLQNSTLAGGPAVCQAQELPLREAVGGRENLILQQPPRKICAGRGGP